MLQGCMGKRIVLLSWWECKLSVTGMESNMEVPQKTRNRATIWSSNATARAISKRRCSRVWQSHLHTRVYCSTAHSSQALAIVQISMSDKWIKKMSSIYTQWSFIQPKSRMKLCCLQANRWN
jgi:hypothetical protein